MTLVIRITARQSASSVVERGSTVGMPNRITCFPKQSFYLCGNPPGSAVNRQPFFPAKFRKLGGRLEFRVNCVAPQMLDTASARASFAKEVLAHAVAPSAIAEVVAFLVSDSAAPVSG